MCDAVESEANEEQGGIEVKAAGIFQVCAGSTSRRTRASGTTMLVPRHVNVQATRGRLQRRPSHLWSSTHPGEFMFTRTDRVARIPTPCLTRGQVALVPGRVSGNWCIYNNTDTQTYSTFMQTSETDKRTNRHRHACMHACIISSVKGVHTYIHYMIHKVHTKYTHIENTREKSFGAIAP